jgi:hypothetical protein
MREFQNQVQGGSRTAPLADDIKTLTEGEDELGFIVEFLQQGGDVTSFGLKKLAQWNQDRRYNSGIRDPRVNEALARRVYQTARPANVKQIEAEIRALPQYGAGSARAKRIGSALVVPGARGGAAMIDRRKEQ